MVSVTVEMKDTTLEQEVDRDILEFEKFFCSRVDKSAVKLSGPEVAIIKTYLYYKTHPNEVSLGNEASSRSPM